MPAFTQKHVGYGLIALSALLMLALVLVKTDSDMKDTFLCEAVSASPDVDMATCPAHQSNISWYIIGEFIISLAILATGSLLVFMHLRREPKKADITGLSNDEKTVYDIVKKNSGSVYQSNIIKDTGFSKAKITRILDRLAGKGIIDRQRRGMTNIIILK